MKGAKRNLVLSLGLGLALVACSRDEEVNKVVADFDAFSKEIVNKVKTASNPAAGIVEAQKYLDANKAAITRRLASIKDVKNFQLSDETKKKMEATVKSDAEAVAGLAMGYVGQLAMNADLRAKFEKLVNDYKGIVTEGWGG